MESQNENQRTTEEEISEEQPTYNFKWMLVLLLVGILGSFIFASFMK